MGPILGSWIEECNQFSGGRVNHMGFVALEFVAPIASSNPDFPAHCYRRQSEELYGH